MSNPVLRPYHHIDEAGVARGPDGKEVVLDEVRPGQVFVDFRTWLPVTCGGRVVYEAELRAKSIVLKPLSDLIFG